MAEQQKQIIAGLCATIEHQQTGIPNTLNELGEARRRIVTLENDIIKVNDICATNPDIEAIKARHEAVCETCKGSGGHTEAYTPDVNRKQGSCNRRWIPCPDCVRVSKKDLTTLLSAYEEQGKRVDRITKAHNATKSNFIKYRTESLAHVAKTNGRINDLIRKLKIERDKVEEQGKELETEREASEIISRANKILADGLEPPLESINVKWNVAKLILINGRLATEKHQLYSDIATLTKALEVERWISVDEPPKTGERVWLMTGTNKACLGRIEPHPEWGKAWHVDGFGYLFKGDGSYLGSLSIWLTHWRPITAPKGSESGE